MASSSLSGSERQSWKTADSTATPPSNWWSGWRRRGDTPTSRRTFTRGIQERAAQSGLRVAAAQTADAPARRTAVAALRSSWKSCRNSSNGTPSSIQSKSCWTGRRVPRKQGTPLMRAGSTQTASSSCMGRSGSDMANVFMGVAVFVCRVPTLKGYAWGCVGGAGVQRTGALDALDTAGCTKPRLCGEPALLARRDVVIPQPSGTHRTASATTVRPSVRLVTTRLASPASRSNRPRVVQPGCAAEASNSTACRVSPLTRFMS